MTRRPMVPATACWLLALALAGGPVEAQSPYGFRKLAVGMSQDAVLAALDQGGLGDDPGCATAADGIVTCRSHWHQADDGTSRKVRAYFQGDRAFLYVIRLSQRRVISAAEQQAAYQQLATAFGAPYEYRRDGQIIWSNGAYGASWWVRVFEGDNPTDAATATVFTITLWDQAALSRANTAAMNLDDPGD